MRTFELAEQERDELGQRLSRRRAAEERLDAAAPLDRLGDAPHRLADHAREDAARREVLRGVDDPLERPLRLGDERRAELGEPTREAGDGRVAVAEERAHDFVDDTFEPGTTGQPVAAWAAAYAQADARLDLFGREVLEVLDEGALDAVFERALRGAAHLGEGPGL